MKKFIICIAVIAAVVFGIFSTKISANPAQKAEEEFGTIWYGTTDASVRVRKMDTKEDSYQVYLCWYNYDGTVKDYQKMGICSHDELVDTVGNAIRFYEDVKE